MCVVIISEKVTRMLVGGLWIVFGPFCDVAFASSADNVIDELEFGWSENESGPRTTFTTGVLVGRGSRLC